MRKKWHCQGSMAEVKSGQSDRGGLTARLTASYSMLLKVVMFNTVLLLK